MDLLEELLAEREIRKVLALYAHYADDNASDDWANLFAEDGVLVVGPQRIQGRETLRAWLAQVQADLKLRHLMVNQHITVESPTTARATMDMILLGADGGRWVVRSSPRYSDRLVKTADGWKFAERVLELRVP